MRNAATVPPHLCAIDATGASWLTSIGMPPLTTGSRSGSSDGPAHIILVVENDVLIRMPLAEYLRECGYRVFEAADVAEAKAVLNADTPVDLVFADANGPPGEENGFMLASWVRQHYPNIEVLLTSSIPNAAAKAGDLCEDLGLVAKPYEHESVLRRIQTLLHHARKAGEGQPP
jgi:DNA-binding response OmpR family regulator